MTNQDDKRSECRELFIKARAGDAEAAQAFFDYYLDRVLPTIRKHMNSDLRCAWDSTDFLQRVRFKVLTCHLEEKHFETPNDLLAYLIRIAGREVQQVKRKKANQLQAEGKHRTAMDDLTPSEAAQLVDGSPQPDSVEEVEECWRRALAALPLVHRTIAQRLRDGYTHAEIAAQLKVSERTVGRTVARLRGLLKALDNDD